MWSEHAQALFQTAILNDTLFLNIVNIVDYSIVVGLDEERRELVSMFSLLLVFCCRWSWSWSLCLCFCCCSCFDVVFDVAVVFGVD